MKLSPKAARRVQVVLGVAAVAGTLGHTVRVMAGPTLSSLTNLTNSGEVTVNNTLGQSFSVDGVLTAAITPFAAAGAATLLQTAAVKFASDTATTQILGLNPLLGTSAGAFNSVVGSVTAASIAGAIQFATLTGVVLSAASGVTTVGAAITNTVFGPSNVKASSAFTNQVTTSLTAF